MAFDNFKVANYPLALVSPELFARHLSQLFSGDIVNGFEVVPGTGLQVTMQAPGNALVRYGAAKVASARLVSLVDDYNLTIATPDASNPRIDLVALYVDNAVSLPSGTPTSANLDGPAVAKAIMVAGTPNASPTAPNSTAIQAAVGAGNPYTLIKQVLVDAGVSVIAGNKITDVRSMATLSAEVINANLSTATGELGGAWQVWTPTLTGFSANPSSAVYRYYKIGKTVYITISQPNNGTSNSTALTVSLPFTAATVTNHQWLAPVMQPVNSGSTNSTNPGLAIIASGGTVATFYRDSNGNTWTNTGGKRIPNFQMFYEAA